MVLRIMGQHDNRKSIERLRHKTMMAVAVVVTILVSTSGRLQAPLPDLEKIPITFHNRTESISTEDVIENDQIIARVHKSVDILDKEVDEVLEKVKHSYRTVRLVPVVITAYNPVSAQTDSTPKITASNKQVKAGMVALSRDIEEEFGFKFGDTVVIEGLGRFTFEDRMNKRWTRRVDILMFSNEAAKRFGVQHSFLVMKD